ncbi:MAG: ribonuclease HII [Candidatus Nanopelagicales bacterium]|nr:ribonuclease HII [Candidatus Nanopelagicales bacterium]
MFPSRDREFQIFEQGFGTIACIDEVGRGAIAGPVVLGLVVVQPIMGEVPVGLRDSKLLSPVRRGVLDGLVREWAVNCAIGEASAQEIDDMGIMRAMALAGSRALSVLPQLPDAILLDGNIDYLAHLTSVPVHTEVKADVHCSGVAAASIIAKVYRDHLMCELDIAVPGYSLALNKGYSAPAHREAIQALGLTHLHRRSWNIHGG